MKVLPEYRPLNKFDFSVSDIALFGLFLPKHVRLSRRPLKRLFFLGLSDHVALDMTLVSAHRDGIRGAVEVTVKYYSLFGGEIAGSSRSYQLFADSVRQATPQRLWMSKPKGAAFVLVAMSRNINGVPIGFSGRLKLHRTLPSETEIAFAEILRCRDEMLLMSAYQKAEEDGEIEHARRVLERMIYIWQKPEMQRALMYLDDARRIARAGFKLSAGLPGTSWNVEEEKALFYDRPYSKVSPEGLLLSKFLQYEIIMLRHHMKQDTVTHVTIGAGPHAFLRAVAAINAGADINWQAGEVPGALPVWITKEEAIEFLRLYS